MDVTSVFLFALLLELCQVSQDRTYSVIDSMSFPAGRVVFRFINVRDKASVYVECRAIRRLQILSQTFDALKERLSGLVVGKTLLDLRKHRRMYAWWQITFVIKAYDHVNTILALYCQ